MIIHVELHIHQRVMSYHSIACVTGGLICYQRMLTGLLLKNKFDEGPQKDQDT